jgi:hypothetical protein
MELLDFPGEILMEIMSKLDQKNRHLTAALVCKRFLQLTRSPQLNKCVIFQVYGDYEHIQSLLDMLRDNKHLENLILESDTRYSKLNILKILKVVAQHDSLRHLELPINVDIPWNNQQEWKKVFSQICTRLTSFKSSRNWMGDDIFAPLVKAKFLTTLKVGSFSSETFRKMADNYTCLQNLTCLQTPDSYLNNFELSPNSDVAYLLKKQSETLTSLKIFTRTRDPIPAISKCRNLKKLDLFSYAPDLNLESLGSLSNLRNVYLSVKNSDLGHIIEAANFQHLNEIGFKASNLTDKDISQISRTYGQQLKKWSMHCCQSITYAGIKDIIEHCTELCDLKLKRMRGLTKADMNAIYKQLLKTGKVDHRNKHWIELGWHKSHRIELDHFLISKYHL